MKFREQEHTALCKEAQLQQEEAEGFQFTEAHCMLPEDVTAITAPQKRDLNLHLPL